MFLENSSVKAFANKLKNSQNNFSLDLPIIENKISLEWYQTIFQIVWLYSILTI